MDIVFSIFIVANIAFCMAMMVSTGRTYGHIDYIEAYGQFLKESMEALHDHKIHVDPERRIHQYFMSVHTTFLGFRKNRPVPPPELVDLNHYARNVGKAEAVPVGTSEDEGVRTQERGV